MSNEDLNGGSHSADAVRLAAGNVQSAEEDHSAEDAQIAALIQLAESDHQSQHPVVLWLNTLDSSEFQQLAEEFSELPFSQREQYLRSHLARLAEALVAIGDFSLTMQDLLFIWAKVMKVFPETHQRYDFAELLMSAYAVQTLTSPAWKTFPRQFYVSEDLPAQIKEDSDGLSCYSLRIKEIRAEIEKIDGYMQRNPRKPSINYEDVKRKAEQGDQSAALTLREYEIRVFSNEGQPLEDTIVENFGNVGGFDIPV